MFPETRFLRHLPVVNSNASGSSLDEKTQVAEAEHAGIVATDGDMNKIEHTNTASSALPNTADLTATETAARDPFLGRGTPGKWQWRMFQPNANPFRSIFLDLWTPWKLFAFPIVEFAAFVVSWSCSSFLTIHHTTSAPSTSGSQTLPLW
jgi:hypothetical protein